MIDALKAELHILLHASGCADRAGHGGDRRGHRARGPPEQADRAAAARDRCAVARGADHRCDRWWRGVPSTARSSGRCWAPPVAAGAAKLAAAVLTGVFAAALILTVTWAIAAVVHSGCGSASQSER